MYQHTDPDLNTDQWEQQMFQIKNPPPKRRTWQDYAVHIWETGDWDCFEAFMHYYEPIINKAVTQYMNRYGLQGHFGDLKMTYVEALCAAMKTYPGGELTFLKYAGRKITAALHGYAMTNLKGFSDTAPTHFYQLRKAAHIYKSGSDSTVEEICATLHVTRKTAVRLIQEAHALDHFCWLDAPLENGEELYVPDDADAMELSQPIRPEAALLRKERWEWLYNGFLRLDYQEQDVISRHLGFYKRCFRPTRPLTFEELADIYQLASANSVMRRYRKAIKKLQGFLLEKQNGETENWDL